tara:strand:+ start:107 stop:1372 length:1266 start_codon:yes stop_codon:yes gene_type:complete
MSNETIITGIDIGTTKVVAVIAKLVFDEEEKEQSIQILGIGEHPSYGLKKGIVVDIKKTTNSLEHAINSAEDSSDIEIDMENVYVGITGDHIKGINYTGKVPVSSSSQNTGIGSEILEKDVARVLEAARAINIPPGRRILHTLSQSYEVDDRKGIRNPVGLCGNTLGVNVHLVTSHENVEKDIETCFRALGIRVREFVLEPLASAYSVLDQNEKDLGVALIDIGGGTTDILVYYDNGIQRSVAIADAGQNITLDISHRFKTDLEQAEQLKHLHGISKVELASDEDNIELKGIRGREAAIISQKMLSEVIEPRMREILILSYEEIKKSNISDKLNFGVVITGGGAQLKNLVDLAQEVFNMPVKIGYPELIDNDTAHYHDNPRYATAIGIIKYAKIAPEMDREIVVGARSRIEKIIKYLTSWY